MEAIPTMHSGQDCNVLKAARDLHQRGFSVIPIQHGEKKATLPWKQYQKERATEAQIHAWFDNETPSNLAIVTGSVSGIVVVDADSAETEEWVRNNLPTTPMIVRTAKGCHFFYRHPGVDVRNAARINTITGELKIDIRGDGGYVVTCPSKHPSGAIYQREGSWEWDDVPVFDSSWFRHSQEETSNASQTSETEIVQRARAYLDKVPGAIQGNGGDNKTFTVACKLLRGFALSDTDAMNLLLEWNRKCTPPWAEAELRSKLEHARKYGTEPVGKMRSTRSIADKTDSTDRTQDEWLEIIPLGQAKDPRPISSDILPPFLREVVIHVAEAVQVPIELPLSVALSTLSTAIGNKAEIQLPYHKEPSPIWTCCVLPPGSRKSAAFKDITMPLRAKEQQIHEEWKDHYRKWKSEADVAEEEIKSCRRAAQKEKDKYARQDIVEHIEKARAVLEAEPKCPHLWTEDTTSECLCQLLQENGSIGVLSAEGGTVFENFGRYNNARGPDMGVYLAGHAGDPGKVSRLRGTTTNQRQLVSLCVTVQPDVIKTIGIDRLAKGRGFLDRLACFIPRDPRGTRSYRKVTPRSEAVFDRWNESVRHILDMEVPETPHIISVSVAAGELWVGFAEEVESRQSADGDLRSMSGWASKLAGLAGRIALVYHLGSGRSHDDAVSEQTMISAISLCRGLIDHAKVFHDIVGTDETMAKARHILFHIIDKRLDEITASRVVHDGWAGCKRVSDTEGAFRLLEAHGYIKSFKPSHQGPGRKPATKYLVNPLISVSSVESDEERAAIMEHEGGLSQEEAEREAQRIADDMPVANKKAEG